MPVFVLNSYRNYYETLLKNRTHEQQRVLFSKAAYGSETVGIIREGRRSFNLLNIL